MEIESGVAEGIQAEDFDASLGFGEVPSGDETQEGALSATVGADEEASRSLGQGEVEIAKRWCEGFGIVGEGEVGDGDGLSLVVRWDCWQGFGAGSGSSWTHGRLILIHRCLLVITWSMAGRSEREEKDISMVI